MKKAIPDVLLIAGTAAVSYGAWLAWNPLGYIVAGVLVIVAGLKLVNI